MRTVTLAKAVRLATGERMRLAGEVVEIDEALFERLSALGAVVDDPSPPADVPPTETVPAPVPEPEPEPVQGSASESGEDEPAPRTSSKRPSKHAGVSAWRGYASSLGLKTTGLSKAELIGAVDAL